MNIVDNMDQPIIDGDVVGRVEECWLSVLIVGVLLGCVARLCSSVCGSIVKDIHTYHPWQHRWFKGMKMHVEPLIMMFQ